MQRQISDQRALVFAKRHAARHQCFQILWSHNVVLSAALCQSVQAGANRSMAKPFIK